jgi:hypothetical protein
LRIKCKNIFSATEATSLSNAPIHYPPPNSRLPPNADSVRGHHSLVCIPVSRVATVRTSFQFFFFETHERRTSAFKSNGHWLPLEFYEFHSLLQINCYQKAMEHSGAACYVIPTVSQISALHTINMNPRSVCSRIKPAVDIIPSGL